MYLSFFVCSFFLNKTVKCHRTQQARTFRAPLEPPCLISSTPSSGPPANPFRSTCRIYLDSDTGCHLYPGPSPHHGSLDPGNSHLTGLLYPSGLCLFRRLFYTQHPLVGPGFFFFQNFLILIFMAIYSCKALN